MHSPRERYCTLMVKVSSISHGPRLYASQNDSVSYNHQSIKVFEVAKVVKTAARFTYEGYIVSVLETVRK